MKIMGKIVKTAGTVLVYILAAVCVFALVLTIASKKDADGAATVFGYQFRIVQSDSMAKSEYTDDSEFEISSFPVKTMLFIQTVPKDEAEAKAWYGELEVGDVLTFRYKYGATAETITHRIVEIEEREEGYEIKLEGDNKASEYHQTLTQTIYTWERETSYNYVIGKVTGKSVALGWLVYALKTPVGIVCIVILPCLIVIVWEIIRIVNVIGEDKRKKEQEKAKQAQDEIEELKRKLAELESKTPPDRQDEQRQ